MIAAAGFIHPGGRVESSPIEYVIKQQQQRQLLTCSVVYKLKSHLVSSQIRTLYTHCHHGDMFSLQRFDEPTNKGP